MARGKKRKRGKKQKVEKSGDATEVGTESVTDEMNVAATVTAPAIDDDERPVVKDV